MREVRVFGGAMNGRTVDVESGHDHLYNVPVLLDGPAGKSIVYLEEYRLDDEGFRFVKREGVA